LTNEVLNHKILGGEARLQQFNGARKNALLAVTLLGCWQFLAHSELCAAR